MLGAAVRESSENAKHINEITSNFSNSSRGADVELPGQWVIATVAVRSLVLLSEQTRHAGVKLMVKMSRGPHNSNLLDNAAWLVSNIIVLECG